MTSLHPLPFHCSAVHVRALLPGLYIIYIYIHIVVQEREIGCVFC